MVFVVSRLYSLGGGTALANALNMSDLLLLTNVVVSVIDLKSDSKTAFDLHISYLANFMHVICYYAKVLRDTMLIYNVLVLLNVITLVDFDVRNFALHTDTLLDVISFENEFNAGMTTRCEFRVDKNVCSLNRFSFP